MVRGMDGTMNQSCLCDSPWQAQERVLRLLPCSELCPIFIAFSLVSRANGLNRLPQLWMTNRAPCGDRCVSSATLALWGTFLCPATLIISGPK